MHAKLQRVSELLNSFEKPFQKYLVSKQYAKKHGLTQQAVIDMWDKNGQNARDSGVFMEDVIVEYYKSFPNPIDAVQDLTPFITTIVQDKKYSVEDLVELNLDNIPFNAIIEKINNTLLLNLDTAAKNQLLPPLFQQEVFSSPFTILGNPIVGHTDLMFVSKKEKKEAFVVELKCAELKFPPQYNEYFINELSSFYKCNIYRYILQLYLYCKFLQIEGFSDVSGMLLFCSKSTMEISIVQLSLIGTTIVVKPDKVFIELYNELYRLLYTMQSLIK